MRRWPMYSTHQSQRAGMAEDAARHVDPGFLIIRHRSIAGKSEVVILETAIYNGCDIHGCVDRKKVRLLIVKNANVIKDKLLLFRNPGAGIIGSVVFVVIKMN
jgi:hypothetical protein